jgi:hypothetical protein
MYVQGVRCKVLQLFLYPSSQFIVYMSFHLHFEHIFTTCLIIPYIVCVAVLC